MRHAAALLLPAALVVGCASVPDHGGFEDVAHTVHERLGKQVAWTNGAEEDARTDEAVRALLAKPLSAEEAVEVALLRNRDLQATYEDLGVAQAALVQAGLLANPVFSLDVRFPSGGGRTQLEGSVVEDFLQVFTRPLRKRVASEEFEAAKLRVTAAVLDLAGEVRAEFVRFQADTQMLEMREQIVRATSASYDAAKALHDAGNTRDLDLAQERALYDRAKLDLAEADAEVAQGRERLNALLGLWGAETAWSVEPRLPEVPADAVEVADVEKRAVAASLDLAAARHEIEAAGARIGLTDVTAWLPGLDAGAAAKREDGPWNAGPSFSLPIPIFDMGQARSAATESDFRQRLDRYYALAVSVRAGARAAAQRLLAARSRAVFYKDEMLPLAARILDEMQLHYNAMQIGVFQLLAAKEHQIETGQRAVEALRDYWIARSDFDQVLRGRRTRGAMRPMSASRSDDAAGAAGGH